MKSSAYCRVSVEDWRHKRFRMVSISACTFASPVKSTGASCGSLSRGMPVLSERCDLMYFSNLCRLQWVATQLLIPCHVYFTEISRIGLCSAMRIFRLNSVLGSWSSGGFPTVDRQSEATSIQSPLIFVISVFICTLTASSFLRLLYSA